MAEETCPGCGMPQSSWEGNGGNGHMMDGDVYCCRGCAEGSGCTCDARQQ